MIHLFHKYRIIKTRHYNDISWGGHAQSTTVIYKCEKCDKIKTKSLYGVGFLTIDDFK